MYRLISFESWIIRKPKAVVTCICGVAASQLLCMHWVFDLACENAPPFGESTGASNLQSSRTSDKHPTWCRKGVAGPNTSNSRTAVVASCYGRCVWRWCCMFAQWCTMCLVYPGVSSRHHLVRGLVSWRSSRFLAKGVKKSWMRRSQIKSVSRRHRPRASAGPRVRRCRRVQVQSQHAARRGQRCCGSSVVPPAKTYGKSCLQSWSFTQHRNSWSHCKGDSQSLFFMIYYIYYGLWFWPAFRPWFRWTRNIVK